MVRVSDGRMSGTAAGTIVLHVTPEAAIGGPLAPVRSGDRIRLSVARRELALLVDDAELARRAAEQPVVRPRAERGYRKLFPETVTQADRGVDFDFQGRRHRGHGAARALSNGGPSPDGAPDAPDASDAPDVPDALQRAIDARKRTSSSGACIRVSARSRTT